MQQPLFQSGLLRGTSNSFQPNDTSLKYNYIFTDFMNKAAVQTEIQPPTAEKPSARLCNKSQEKYLKVRTTIIPALPETAV